MRGQVAVEIAWVAKAHKLCSDIRGADCDAVIFHQGNGRLPIDTEDSILTVHLDANRGALR